MAGTPFIGTRFFEWAGMRLRVRIEVERDMNPMPPPLRMIDEVGDVPWDKLKGPNG